ncbi:MAG: MoxR family ATPase [Planctomycetota bacterium]|nr:MoxR family ATPase [Planctomycetota bacterium]
MAKLRNELAKVIVGQDDVIQHLIATIMARGHCLMVGVPGLAKTLLVSTLSNLFDLSFKRVQFTPDLMPSDITGTQVLEEDEDGRREFRFRAGPLFANIVLADEINRTPPKTQAALLESMQERQVTVGKESYHLPRPFFVVATQNPIEQEGTYPLPEAQLDRFMFMLEVNYPSESDEEKILIRTTSPRKIELSAILDAEQVIHNQRIVDAIAVTESVVKYVTRLVRATRPRQSGTPGIINEFVEWGAGPRAGQYLILGAKAIAAMEGRVAINFSDIRRMARPVLRHRLGLNFQAQAEGVKPDTIVSKLLEVIEEPEVGKYEQG